MERGRALPRIAAALAAMNTCLKRCEIDAIPSTRSCAHGRECILIPSCFPCRRSTRPWPTFDSTFFFDDLIQPCREVVVFAQKQMAVLAQGWRRRFPPDVFRTGFSRRGTGSIFISGAPRFSVL